MTPFCKQIQDTIDFIDSNVLNAFGYNNWPTTDIFIANAILWDMEQYILSMYPLWKP